jgi:hypothetical protein
MDVFEVTRFFCSLAVVDKKAFDAVMLVCSLSKDSRQLELVKNWADFPA